MSDLPPKGKVPSSPHRSARGGPVSAPKASPSRPPARHVSDSVSHEVAASTASTLDVPPSIPPRRSGVGTRKRKRKIVDSEDDEELHLRGDGKGENKLGPTAVKFISKLKSSPNQTMDLNDASAQLGVPKRRIYDITNVLEGLGTVVKTDKNTVHYGGARTTHIAPPEFSKTAAEIRRLDEQIQGLDEDIARMQGAIDKYVQRGIYMLRDDIVKSRVTECSGSLILIRARPGTTFEGEIAKVEGMPSRAHFADSHPIHCELIRVHHLDRLDGFPFYTHPPIESHHPAEIMMSQEPSSSVPPAPHHTHISSVDYSLSGGDTTPSRSAFSTPTRPNHSTLELSPPPHSERYMGMDFYSPARPPPHHISSGGFSPYSAADRFAWPPMSPQPRLFSPGPYSQHHLSMEPETVEWKDPEPPGGFRSMFNHED